MGAEGFEELPTSILGVHRPHFHLTEQYLGHTPKTVTGKHYIARLNAVSAGEAEALERQMALFRKLVIEPLDESIARDGTTRILNFFESKQKQEGA